jgi:hypothetical protein
MRITSELLLQWLFSSSSFLSAPVLWLASGVGGWRLPSCCLQGILQQVEQAGLSSCQLLLVCITMLP